MTEPRPEVNHEFSSAAYREEDEISDPCRAKLNTPETV
jgi:hypothetical protein